MISPQDPSLIDISNEIFTTIGNDIRKLKQQLEPSGVSVNNDASTEIPLNLLDDASGNEELDLFIDSDADSFLKSAITISVYSDARVDGKRGWWGDSYRDSNAGTIAHSKLWTILGKPATAENTRLGKDHVKAALQWLIDDKLLSNISVIAEHQSAKLDIFAFKIIATTPEGKELIVTL